MHIFIHIIPYIHESSNIQTLKFGIFYGSFPNKIFFIFPLRVACRVNFFRLDLITLIIFGEEYEVCNFQTCSFLHSPVTSSFKDQDIIVTSPFQTSQYIY
jgi:hypothetical protein